MHAIDTPHGAGVRLTPPLLFDKQLLRLAPWGALQRTTDAGQTWSNISVADGTNPIDGGAYNGLNGRCGLPVALPSCPPPAFPALPLSLPSRPACLPACGHRVSRERLLLLCAL